MWLANVRKQQNKKGFHGCSCFIECKDSLFLSAMSLFWHWKQILIQIRSVTAKGCQYPAYSNREVTCLASYESLGTLMPCGIGKGNGRHTAHAYFFLSKAHSIGPSGFTDKTQVQRSFFPWNLPLYWLLITKASRSHFHSQNSNQNQKGGYKRIEKHLCNPTL